MTRTLSALVALAAAAATLTVATPAPAEADGGTYADTTTITFRDAAGDAPNGVDLRRGDVDLDPNLPFLFAHTAFDASYAEPSFVVLRLGELVSGSCEIRVEVVSNRWNDSVVRDPGETALPPAEAPGYDDSVSARDARLDLVPTCARLDLVDPEGAVLDTAAGVVRHTPVGRGTLGVAYGSETIRNVDSGKKSRFPLRISANGPVYDVTLDAVAGDPGLVLSEAHFELGRLGNPDTPRTSRVKSLVVTATPGRHTLTLRLSGGNAATTEVNMTIWGRGGPALAARDSLAGRTFFSQNEYYTPTDGYRRRWTAYAFVDDTWARPSYNTSVQSPQASYQPCTRPNGSCQRYAYDARTGAVQIGADRGELRDGALWFHDVKTGARLARAGSTVAFVGRNFFDGGYYKADFRLVLRKDGTFTRTTEQDYGNVRITQRGRYRIGAHGLLIARTSTGKVLRTRLAFLVDEQGRPRPQLLGVYAFDVWFRPKARG